jgi:cell division cycle 2-like
MKRRDRWASSSDEDDTGPKIKPSRRKIVHREKSSPAEVDVSAVAMAADSLATNGGDHDGKNSYNPLLQGCRSVYDTYEQMERISEGTYGIVWKARCLSSSRIVALKQMKFPAEPGSRTTLPNGVWKDGFPLMALREINALLALRGHDNIVALQEIVMGQWPTSPPPQLYMVMEYYHCDLKTAIHKYTTEVIAGPLLQSELKGILQQILTGIQFIHSKNYLHRDLKPSNILVQCNFAGSTAKCRIAIADFGLARLCSRWTHCHMTLPVVTLWYRAPELLFGQTQYTSAIDMWSMGCIMGELVRSSGIVPLSLGSTVDDDDFEHSSALVKGRGELDQIDSIFQLVGVPNATTWPLFDTLPNAKLLRWKAIPDQDILLPKLFAAKVGSTSGQQTFLDGNGYELLRQLLTLDPLQRMDATHALNHPYFTEGIVPQIPNFTF